MKMFIERYEKSLYFILVWLVAIVLIGLNEVGYGGIAYLPLMLLEVWLVRKAYREKA